MNETDASADPERRRSANPHPSKLFGRAFVLVLCVHPFLGFTFSAFVLLPKMLATQYGAGPVVIGQVTAAGTIAAMLAAFGTGPLVDRLGRKPLFVVGAALEALSALGFLWVDHVGPWLFALRAIQGAAFATAFNALSALVVDITPKQRSGQALGLMGLSGLVMNAIAPVIAEPIANRYGWSPVFLLAALTALVGFLGGVILLDEPPAPKADVSEGEPIRHPVDVYAASMLVGVGLGIMFNFVQPFALSRGITKVSTFFIAYTMAAVFVRGALGSMPDRVGRRKTAMAAQFLYALAVFGTAGLRPGFVFPLLGVLLGLAHGLAYPTLAALAVENVPRLGRGLVMALFYGGYNLGVTAGQLAFGPLAAGSGYPFAFLIMGALLLTGVPLVAPKTRSTALPIPPA